jgi:hypothetical protein
MLESLRDGCKVWIYGERVKDIHLWALWSLDTDQTCCNVQSPGAGISNEGRGMK